MIDVDEGYRTWIEAPHSLDCACELGNFDALVFAGRAAGSNGGAVAVAPTSND